MDRSAPVAGALLGSYRLIEEIGAGGVAVVWRAEGPEGRVAVKVLRANLGNSDESRRLRREFLMLERLSHPHVVKVFDMGDHHGWAWMAMELVDGQDLGELITSWEREPPPDRWGTVERILRQLLDALAYIHGRGIVHRDLKPQNVLIDRFGSVRLTDFGALKEAAGGQSTMTQAGQIIGTIAFLAPEMITADGFDHRADLYSLGALLYMALTGRRPLTADSIAAYLARHLSELPRAPSELDPHVPPRLERVCMRLLQKDPDHRPGSAAAVLALLDAPDADEGAAMQGREGEVARVLDRVQASVKSRIGAVIALTGPVGSGRTRLLREVGIRLAERGIEVRTNAPPPGGRSPVVWLLDDADLLDPFAALELEQRVDELLGAAEALVVVCAQLPGGSIGNLIAEEIPLPRLTLPAIRAMLRDRGLYGGVGAMLARRIAEEVERWPGPILEQLDALVHAGWLARDRAGDLRALRTPAELRTGTLPLPARVAEVEAAFLEALSPGALAVVEVLAVLGSPSGTALVAAVAGISEAAATEILEELVAQDRVAMSSDGLQELWSIPHRRRLQAVLDRLAPTRRTALHREAAAALTRLYRRRSGAVAEMVAHHLLQAGDGDAAVPLLIAGAWRSLQRHDATAALGLARRALGAIGPATAGAQGRVWRRDLFLALGDAERLSGRPAEAENAYAQALLLARELGERAAVGHAVAGMGLAGVEAGRGEEAAGYLDEATGTLRPGDRAWADAASASAMLNLLRGDLTRATREWTAIEDASTGGARVDIEARAGLTLVEWARGGAPVAAMEALSNRAREAGLFDLAARLLRWLAELRLERGEWSAALRVADLLDDIGDRAALPFADLAARAMRAAAFQGGGNSVAAVTAAQEAIATARLHQVRAIGLWAWPTRVLVARGDGMDVLPVLDGRTWAPDPPWQNELSRRALRALLLSSIRPVDAREEAEACAQRWDDELFPAAAMRVALDLSIVWTRLRRPQEAHRWFDLAERSGRRPHDIDGVLRVSGSM